MPIGPPSLGGSGGIGLPLPPPPRYQPPSRQPTVSDNGPRQQQPLPVSDLPSAGAEAPQVLSASQSFNHHLPNASNAQPNLEAAQQNRPLQEHPAVLLNPSSMPLSSSFCRGPGVMHSSGRRSARCMHRRPFPGGSSSSSDSSCMQAFTRKYVLLCGACGLCSVVLGSLYLVIHFLLRSYTSSLQYFETMPTYVPATVQILTGLLVVCFVRRKHRIGLLVKLCGLLCLVCAVLCVVVTVTTTVLHMNRLQTLHECEFVPHALSCTCTTYTGIYEPGQEALRYVFSEVSSCDVIHGPLYACLRAIFGLSVIGILVSIFSCMLVYQLLSHEKKKMYWEELESRRRLLYPRPYTLPSSSLSPEDANPSGVLPSEGEAPRSDGDCGCCTDEYGFPSHPTQESLYPYTLWDPMDERCWSSGLVNNEPDGQSAGPRSVLVHLPHSAFSRGGSVEDTAQSSAHSGILLRPFLHRGLDGHGRVGYRRQHHHGTRPLSDPGVALHLPPYPPPSFTEAFLPMGYPPEAFPGYLWGPPPPYSQPTSTENIATISGNGGTAVPSNAPQNLSSPAHDAPGIMMSPMHRPATLADMMRGPNSTPAVRGISSSNEGNSIVNSPSHILSRPARARPKRCDENVITSGINDGSYDGSNSLPLRRRTRRIPLGHVKSLGDVTEDKKDETLGVILCDRKEISSLDKIHNEMTEQKSLSKHLKSVSDPKSVYSVGKVEPESEIYFADVSSCVSLRPEGEEVMYYSDPTNSGSQRLSQQLYQDPSSQSYIQNLTSSISSSHMYEQVRGLDEEEEEEEEMGSHHTSDDTMIVHTSSSDHSMNGENCDTENTYSVISPATDLSSVSPMVTDTDAYSCYTPITPNASNNLNNLAAAPFSISDDADINSIEKPLERINCLTQLSDQSTAPVASNGNQNENASPNMAPSSVNMHHPIRPVRHPQHQAYRHHLGHGHDLDDRMELNRNNQINISVSKMAKKSSTKKGSRRSKKEDTVTDESRYEQIDSLPISVPKPVEKNKKKLHSSANTSSTSTSGQKSNKVLKHRHQSHASTASTCNKSHPRHKSRQLSHHRHPTSSPGHRKVSSSSSSSPVSSSCSPSTSLPQGVAPADLNGNSVPTSTPVAVHSNSSALSSEWDKAVNICASSNCSLSSSAFFDSSGHNVVSPMLSSGAHRSTHASPTKGPCSSNPSTPSKPQKCNLSLPLQKISNSTEIEKSPVAVKSRKYEKSCNKNSEHQVQESTESSLKKKLDKDSLKSRERRRPSRDSSTDANVEQKFDSKKPDLDTKHSKKLRRGKEGKSSKQEDRQEKEASSSSNAEVPMTTASGHPPSVHRLLQNLKSVNV